MISKFFAGIAEKMESPFTEMGTTSWGVLSRRGHLPASVSCGRSCHRHYKIIQIKRRSRDMFTHTWEKLAINIILDLLILINAV